MTRDSQDTRMPMRDESDSHLSSRKRMLLIGGLVLAAVVVVAVVAVALGLGSHGESDRATGAGTLQAVPKPTASATPTPKSSAPTASSAQSKEVPEADKEGASKVLEQAPTNLEANVAEGAREQYGYTDPNQVFPPGSKLDIDQSTWTRVDDNTVMVKVTLTKPGSAPVDYAALMARESAQAPWKIVGTLDWADR